MVYSVAALAVPGTDDEVYFFQGTRFALVKLDTSPTGTPAKAYIQRSPSLIHGAWPQLTSAHLHTVDAVLPKEDGSTWFLSRDKCIHVSVGDRLADNSSLDAPRDIIVKWSSLGGANFSSVDAALPDPRVQANAYLFSGQNYVYMNTNTGRILNGPKRIVDGWDALKTIGFATVDMILPYTNPATNESGYYFFSGDKCAFVVGVERAARAAQGLKPISVEWPVLREARFY